jgi:DNA-directed RNA polymerase subunit H (RpoH/RPB5)
MNNADRFGGTINLPVDNGLSESHKMLTVRGCSAKVSDFCAGDAKVVWSYARGNVAVACVEVLDKASSSSLIAAAKVAKKDLVVIYTRKYTNDARRAFEDHKSKYAVESWKLESIFLNPTKYKYFVDSGRIPKDKVTPDILERIGGNCEENAETYETDPLPKYLGAKAGDLVWTKNTWGTLEPSVDYRVVISAKKVPRLFAA